MKKKKKKKKSETKNIHPLNNVHMDPEEMGRFMSSPTKSIREFRERQEAEYKTLIKRNKTKKK